MASGMWSRGRAGTPRCQHRLSCPQHRRPKAWLLDATKYRAGSQRSLELLAILGLMTDFRPKGSMVIQDPEYSRRLAQNLVELLSPYEEELIQLERDAPAFGPLRRAIGIVIAEACYCISDRPDPIKSLAPSADDEASRTDDEANRAR